MRILLLGNKGQVGQELERLATTKNIKTVGFDIDNLDISDAVQLNNLFKHNHKFDIVVNAAAYTNVDQAEDEPQNADQANHIGPQNLAYICHQYNIPLLHISTDYVFSGDKLGPYLETDLTEPLTVYGRSKLAGDQAITKILEKYVILRVSWVFGKYGNNFVKKILHLAKEQAVLNIVGDQTGCPTAAADIARVIIIIAEKIFLGQTHWGIYNYCNYPVTTWYQFATKIVELGRNKFSLKVKTINETTSKNFPTKAKRPKNSELMVGKITQDYGIIQKDWERYLVEII